jgi:hypothetical protein
MEEMSVSEVPVSVAIPAYKRGSVLRDTLERIVSCRPLPAEILIHADGGWDPQLEGDNFGGVPLRVISSDKNVGPGGGRDRLIREAKYDLVASFDDDSWPVDKDYFARVKSVMDCFPKAAVMSPAVSVLERPILPNLPEVTLVRSFEGSASVTRRSLYLTLPGYVPVPEAYGVEEADLSLQVHAAGLQLLSCPWIRAWHDRPNSDDQHGAEPWVRNEVLLGSLRYPRVLQPWAWGRALRHILRHRRTIPLVRLLVAFGQSFALCHYYRPYRKRYTFTQVVAQRIVPPTRWVLSICPEGTVSATETAPGQRVVYLQYTNPGGYPPLEHGSQILAKRGWEVLFLGCVQRGRKVLELPQHPRITVRSTGLRPTGWQQRLHYLYFSLWALWHCWRFRADWVYVSDAIAAPVARLMRLLNVKILYHEHDSPTIRPGEKRSLADRLILRHRLKLAASAEVVVLPNQERLDALIQQAKPIGHTVCVWNVPKLSEVIGGKAKPSRDQPLRVLYHGSINPKRFPKTVLKALAKCGPGVVVRLVGYETVGYIGYTNELLAKAERLGIQEQFESLGTLPLRKDLMATCGECDVGLSLLTISEDDINMRHMAGASNKPFDYLSQGLALIVPPDSAWEAIFVAHGCARSCALEDEDGLAQALAWFRDHREETRSMGLRGQAMICNEWNYERQFAPVVSLIES